MDTAKRNDFYIAPKPGESTVDFRERLAQRRIEELELRRRELTEQASEIHTPADRIKIWERLHQIALPRNPTHPVLTVIAANTGLSLADVHAEQQQRKELAATPKS